MVGQSHDTPKNENEELEQESCMDQPENTTPADSIVEPEIIAEETTDTLSAVELMRLTGEARDYKDKYLRALADSENLRKRMIKEKEEYSKFAVANTIVEFLQPLDNLEKALSFAEKGSEEVRNWAKGFEMIITQFKDVLAHHGVAPIKTVGAAFDPHRHEAVEVEETDISPPGTILEEFTRGYIMGDRTIRPARVKVSKKPQPTAPLEEETDTAPQQELE